MLDLHQVTWLMYIKIIIFQYTPNHFIKFEKIKFLKRNIKNWLWSSYLFQNSIKRWNTSVPIHNESERKPFKVTYSSNCEKTTDNENIIYVHRSFRNSVWLMVMAIMQEMQQNRHYGNFILAYWVVTHTFRYSNISPIR